MPIPTDSPDKKAGIAFLTKYASQMEALMALLSSGNSVSKPDRAQITEMYRTLKNCLKEDYRRLARKDSRGEATHIETAFLLPAVHQASTRLIPPTNSNPSNSRWLDAVYSAKIDIDHLLNQLNK